jgi:TolB-like protein
VRALLFALLAVLALVPGTAHAGAVAVLYFENQGNPELESLKVGLAQMLVTDLGKNPQLQVVERARLQEILNELDLGHSGKVDPATAAKVGQLVGAEWLVMGSYFEVMGTMRIDARLVKVQTGEIVHAHGVDGAPKEFLQMEKGLAGSFTAALLAAEGKTGALPPREEPAMAVVAPAPPVETADAAGGGRKRAKEASGKGGSPAPAAPPPPAPAPAGASETVVVAPNEQSLNAAIAFSEGLIHLDQKDVPRAREAFEKAVAADPHLEAARAELDRLKL